MGFREIAMIVVSLILVGILGLAVAPSITASGDATKGAIVVNEIEAIVAAANMYAVNTNQDGDITGLTAESVSKFIPNLQVNSMTARLKSKVFSNELEYMIDQWGLPDGKSAIRIYTYGATEAYNSREHIKSFFVNKYGASNWTDRGNDFTILIPR